MSLIVVPPPGMPYPLARMLIEDPTFAHNWLCHGGDGSQCPDGCSGEHTHPSAGREEMYSNIRCYFVDSEVRAYRRGYEDAAKGKGALFRKVAHVIVATIDDDMSDNWDDDMRQAYLDGYEAGL